MEWANPIPIRRNHHEPPVATITFSAVFDKPILATTMVFPFMLKLLTWAPP
jgi:hypothetical protein